MITVDFDDLLRSAREESQPQRLLFVFTKAGLAPNATPAQRARFKAGKGGTLTPLMCVDKLPEELPSFDALIEESRRAGPAWDVVFVAALPGSAGHTPTDVDAEEPLQRMVDSINSGSVENFLPFDIRGKPLNFG